MAYKKCCSAHRGICNHCLLPLFPLSGVINHVAESREWWAVRGEWRRQALLHRADVVNPLQTGALQPVLVCCLGNGLFPFLERWRNQQHATDHSTSTSIISTLHGYAAFPVSELVSNDWWLLLSGQREATWPVSSKGLPVYLSYSCCYSVIFCILGCGPPMSLVQTVVIKCIMIWR